MSGVGRVAGSSALWRALLRHRRTIGAFLSAVAVVLAVSAARPRPVPTVGVWVAARNLVGGAPLQAADLRLAQLPSSGVPDHAIRAGQSVSGRFLAAPMRRGEPLTDVRLLAPALIATAGGPGALAVPVRVSDASAAIALVQAGDSVDVMAAGDPGSATALPAGPVVQDVRVLSVARPATDDAAGLVVVAANPAQAAAVAAIPPGATVSLALRRNP